MGEKGQGWSPADLVNEVNQERSRPPSVDVMPGPQNAAPNVQPWSPADLVNEVNQQRGIPQTMLKGGMEEDAFADRKVPTNVGEFAENVGKGFEGFKKLGTALSSVASMRAREVGLDVLSRTPGISKPTADFLRNLGGQAVRVPTAGPYGLSTPPGTETKDSDLLMAAQAAKGAGQYVENQYVKPFARGPVDLNAPVKHGPFGAYTERMSPDYIGHLVQQGLKAPVEETLDLLPLSTGSYGALAKIIKAHPQQALLAGRLTKNVAPFLKNTPEWQAAILPKWLKELTPSGAAKKVVLAALQKHETARIIEVLKARDELDQAFEGLSGTERKELTGVIEQTDKRLMAKYAANPELQAKADRALDAVAKFNTIMRRTFDIPEPHTLQAVYGPQLLMELEAARLAKLARLTKAYKAAVDPRRKALLKGRIQDASVKVISKDLPRYMPRLRKLKASLEAGGGRLPGHAPVATEVQVARALNDALGKLLGGLKGKTVNVAKKMALGKVASVYKLPKEEIPGYLRQRMKAGPGKAPLSVKSGVNIKLLEKLERNRLTRIERLKATHDATDINKLGGKAKREALKAKIEELSRYPNYTNVRQNASEWKDAMEGIRGPGHELDLKKLTWMNHTKVARYQAIKGLVQDLAAMGTQDSPGFEAINIKDELLKAAAEHDANPSTVNDLFKSRAGGVKPQETIYLPKSMIRLLKGSLEERGPTNPFVHWTLDVPNRIFGHMMFKVDPSFGIRLGIQTAALQAYTLRGPKDLAGMIAAHVIASNPKARSVIPPEIMLSHGAHADPDLLFAALTYQARLAQQYKKLIALKGHFDYELIHHLQRRAAVVEWFLYRSKDAPASYKRIFADMLHAEDALEDVREGTYNPEQLKALQGYIKGVYGDYSTMATEQRRMINRVIPVSAWVAHAIQIIKTLPKSHPYKTAMVSYLHDLDKQLQTDSHGRMPVRDVHGNFVLGPKGQRKYMKGLSLDVMDSGMQIVQDMAELMFSGTEMIVPSDRIAGAKFKIPSAITPLYLTGAETFSGVDFSSGIPFADLNPRLKKEFVQGQIVYRDIKTGKQYDPRTNYLGPNPFLLLAEHLARKQVTPIQRMITGEKQATKWTRPGQPMPGTKRGRELKADQLEQILDLGGFMATEGKEPVKLREGVTRS